MTGPVVLGGQVRAESPERRAARRMHPVRHSVGLVLSTADPHGEWSFRVGPDGALVELGGWGYSGPVDLDALANPPANALAVHTVLVGLDDNGRVSVEAFLALRELIEEHVRRYAECQVWTAAGAHRALVAWTKAGCPEPDLLAVPTGEEQR